MGFDRVLRETFPGALAEDSFVHSVRGALDQHGFRPGNAMACVATCRDEISQSWASQVSEVWGAPFSLTGLGGLILAGKTGFGAALSHAPNRDGRERYVFFAGPHVAVGSDGEPGSCSREGRSGDSTACGAIAAVLGEIRAGRLGATDDPDDLELGQLRLRVGRPALEAGTSDLFHLTRRAHDVIADGLEAMLAEVVDLRSTDYAVATGIQVHTPDAGNLIWPGRLFAVVSGERRDVEHAEEISA